MCHMCESVKNPKPCAYCVASDSDEVNLFNLCETHRVTVIGAVCGWLERHGVIPVGTTPKKIEVIAAGIVGDEMARADLKAKGGH